MDLVFERRPETSSTTRFIKDAGQPETKGEPPSNQGRKPLQSKGEKLSPLVSEGFALGLERLALGLERLALGFVAARPWFRVARPWFQTPRPWFRPWFWCRPWFLALGLSFRPWFGGFKSKGEATKP